ncbi:hypothetical protein NCU16754 [Neurospora crassa OR74A]|uniref:Uncharacterized protein n=1 Tax=Neurospora crassa (strain ATCC 24698 / 74-OR23-1A / CBS 708.71 / DSM 1257 / FGSC 987) TaxID=367110 RepID=V5INQ9_NEUCR|nr:hypothetical protein NCU16754 [Neurospora crassa OR74A]ESA42799.1 hypothetical protein NCU16754 [Neurospora crassa OR74A]|eukprot:XP_011394369.1 hypothetical protein NCU16754 [Neurospora crassa OR74A]
MYFLTPFQARYYCLAWSSRSRMQKDCIAVQYSRHAKRSCIQSSRFRIRRGELNSHAFSLVNRLQHQILRAICSNRRRFPLAKVQTHMRRSDHTERGVLQSLSSCLLESPS